MWIQLVESQKMFRSGTQIELANGNSGYHFFYRNMILFIASCWVFINNHLFHLFKFISRYIFRTPVENRLDELKLDLNTQKEDGVALAAKGDDSECFDSVTKVHSFENLRCDDGLGEKVAWNFNFKFQLRSSEDIRRNVEETEVFPAEESRPVAEIRKYSFLPKKDVIGFLEEPTAAGFTIEKLHVSSRSSSFIDNNKIHNSEFQDGILSEKDFHKFNSGTEAVYEEPLNNSFNDFFCEQKESSEQSVASVSCEYHLPAEEALIDFESESLGKKDIPNDDKSQSEKETHGPDSNPGFSSENPVINSTSSEFLQVSDCGRSKDEPDTRNCRVSATPIDFDGQKTELMEDIQNSEATHLQNSCNSDKEPNNFIDGFPSATNQADDHCISDNESVGLNYLPSVMIQIKDETKSSKSDSERVSFEIDTASFAEEDTGAAEKFEKSKSVCHQNLPISSEESIDPSNELSSAEEKGSSELETDSFAEQVTVSAEKFEKSKSECHQNLPISSDEFIDPSNQLSSAEKDYGDPKYKFTETHGKETGAVDESQRYRGTQLHDTSNSNSDNPDSIESLWEHEDLVDQLRIELKKVRAIGLPTIYEESEIPKMIDDDLKPWKVEEKFLHEDPMDELHKFYGSYRERMRKLDILNYQKMHAIGFLQIKEPIQSMAGRKTSLLSQNLWLGRSRKSDMDPSAKFIKELQSDLEMVYVGQACLSWEFLHWQYQRTCNLPESDPHDDFQYNQVAGEFQQFQVLLQRFLENEPFLQGPRVQNYVQNRCIFRNLLQVPAIKEDCLKDKMAERKKVNDGTTGAMLAEIMEEAMRTLWEFIKADKDEANAILKGFLRVQSELQDPKDSELLKNIHADHQKKEKKLKDLLRTGNCLVKRFQKHQENRSDLVLFFSQVDIRLVSRVLKMSRITTDQLVWCHKKLSKITFRNRKIQRESSFLLFPC